MSDVDPKTVDTGTGGEWDHRTKREDLLAAVVRAFPVDINLPYGSGARYNAVFEDRSTDLLQSLLSGRMATVMRRWNDLLDKATRQHGLSFKHWQALFMVGVNKPGETLTSIAARMGVISATLVRILHDLEESGLIERKIDEKDRRAKILDLTPLGEQTFFSLIELNCDLRRQFLNGVSESGMLLMVEAADIMEANLEKMAAEE